MTDLCRLAVVCRQLRNLTGDTSLWYSRRFISPHRTKTSQRHHMIICCRKLLVQSRVGCKDKAPKPRCKHTSVFPHTLYLATFLHCLFFVRTARKISTWKLLFGELFQNHCVGCGSKTGNIVPYSGLPIMHTSRSM
jgi:hypothetical protein